MNIIIEFYRDVTYKEKLINEAEEFRNDCLESIIQINKDDDSVINKLTFIFDDDYYINN